MDQMSDDFSRGFGIPTAWRTGWPVSWPHADVTETEDDFRGSAELPGMDAKDVKVTLYDGVLGLKCERNPEVTAPAIVSVGTASSSVLCSSVPISTPIR